LGSGLILCAILQLSSAMANMAVWRGIAAMGVYSYSIYLLHPTVKLVFEQTIAPRLGETLGKSWAVEAFVYYGGSIAVGIAFSLLLEWPILRLRDRLFPSNSARHLSPTSLERRSDSEIAAAKVAPVQSSLPAPS
jgi:peptidoglycan/LPS O-acetylase OafA/YrhL